jgi:hypothetical protein
MLLNQLAEVKPTYLDDALTWSSVAIGSIPLPNRQFLCHQYFENIP